jgi:DNA-binding NarL/FixJ family response regulator
MSPDPVHVLLADDHPVYRDGLAGLLGATTDLVVVG